jgi:hypothetical protein
VPNNKSFFEATLSGAGLSIVAAITMIFFLGMELNSYLTDNTTTNIVVDRSQDGDLLRIDFNISFLILSCKLASVDMSDVLSTNRLNMTKTVRQFLGIFQQSFEAYSSQF